MKSLPYCWAVIVSLMITAAPVSAAIISDGNYVQVRAQLDAGDGPASGGDTIITNPSSADTGTTNVVNGDFSASGRALTGVSGGPALKSVSSSTAPDAAGLLAPSSSTQARSSWRDVLLPNAAGAPLSLNFNFSVHALLNVSQTTDSGIAGNTNFSDAGVSVTASNTIIGFVGSTIGSGLSANVRNLNGASTVIHVNDNSPLNWDTALFTSLGSNAYEFNGSFTYTSALLGAGSGDPDAPFGAYFLGVGLTTLTSNVGGTSMADAFSTLSLDSITMLNGDTISSTGYNFESGAALSSIPIPPSWLLMLSAIAVSMTQMRRKQK